MVHDDERSRPPPTFDVFELASQTVKMSGTVAFLLREPMVSRFPLLVTQGLRFLLWYVTSHVSECINIFIGGQGVEAC